MTDDAERTFLSRWSRRKSEARAAERTAAVPGKPEQSDAATAPASSAAVTSEGTGDAANAGAPAKVELPDPETLRGLESEYRDFLRPEVDESLRRTALKKLFADPHFNVMDGLDVYIDDYSKPDPISPALLRTMNQARGLRLFDDEEEAQAESVSAAAAPPATEDVALRESVAVEDAALAAQADDPATVSPTDCPQRSEASLPAPDGSPGERKKG
jgi:hypothetical protein